MPSAPGMSQQEAMHLVRGELQKACKAPFLVVPQFTKSTRCPDTHSGHATQASPFLRRPLFGYSIAAKRYALYTKTHNDIEIVEPKAHGLGNLLRTLRSTGEAGKV